MTLISAVGENRNLKAAQPPNPVNLAVSVVLDLIFQETAASDRAGFPVIQSTDDASITAKGRDACFCARRPCDCMVITTLKDQAVTGSAAGDCCFKAL
jgi:hypothetical protein